MEPSRVLTVSVFLTSPETFDVTIVEPESGDVINIPCHFRGNTVNAENQKITSEIREWAVWLLESAQEEEE